jgi:hypothetical protein
MSLLSITSAETLLWKTEKKISSNWLKKKCTRLLVSYIKDDPITDKHASDVIQN